MQDYRCPVDYLHLNSPFKKKFLRPTIVMICRGSHLALKLYDMLYSYGQIIYKSHLKES